MELHALVRQPMLLSPFLSRSLCVSVSVSCSVSTKCKQTTFCHASYRHELTLIKKLKKLLPSQKIIGAKLYISVTLTPLSLFLSHAFSPPSLSLSFSFLLVLYRPLFLFNSPPPPPPCLFVVLNLSACPCLSFSLYPSLPVIICY